MLKKLAGYFALALGSFGIFTGLFHSTSAYAQGTIIPIPSPTKAETPQITPSPTIFFTVVEEPASTDNPKLVKPTVQPTATPLPTKKDQSTEEKKQITITPTPTTKITPTPTAQTAVAAGQNIGGLNAEKLFSMSNAHRQSIGLPALQKDEKTCSLATARASEIAAEMAAGTLHSGMYGRNLPYWNTENAIAIAPEEAAFNWWLGDPIHRQAIESPTHTISCVACSGNYCVQEFTSYQPK
ncbi:MAG: CAP domain-containing protein [Patescibacteria group bacterium]